METKVRVVDLERKNLALRWIDPETGKVVQKSARTSDKKQAIKLAAQLEADLNLGRYAAPSKISWDDFRDRFENDKLPSLSPKSCVSYGTALNHVERLLRPKRLADLTASQMNLLQVRLRKTGLKETSIATQLRHVRGALGWACHVGMIAQVPKIEMPKRAKGITQMRGRPITAEELERMLSATELVRPRDAAHWRHYLEGLWLSGLRLEESLLLSWDPDALLSIDFSGEYPRLEIRAEGEKGHRDRLLPITPDFGQFLLRTPIDERQGLVFRLDGLITGKPISTKRVSRIVSQFGKKAGVVVNREAKKFASAHDLRRAYGTRWTSRVKPAVLQKLMRHENIETTLKYYVALDVNEIAAELWNSIAKTSTPDSFHATQKSDTGHIPNPMGSYR